MKYTFEVHSSNGTIIAEKESGKVVYIDDQSKEKCLIGITRIDTNEWKLYHGKDEVDDDIDILDLGYWYTKDGEDDHYEEPTYSWRSEWLTNEDRIRKVRQDAELAFWEVVAQNYPEIKQGDYSPDDTFRFVDQCEQAIKIWLETNNPNENAGKIYDNTTS